MDATRSSTVVVVAVAVVLAVVPGTVAGVGVAAPAADGTDAAGGTPGSDDETVTLSGRFLEADGDPAANQTLVVFRETDGLVRDDRQVRLGPDGGFSLTVPAGDAYRLVYYQVRDGTPDDGRLAPAPAAGPNVTAYPTDGSPDVYAVARLSPAADVDLGPVRLPTAYPLAVRATTERGGVPTATYDVTDHNPGAGVHGGLTGVGADEAGALRLGGDDGDDGDDGVVEVRGEVTVTVRPNATDTYPNATTREFDVDQATDYEFAFDYNEAPEATIRASTAEAAVGETVGFNVLESVDPDGRIADVAWEFDGDGETDARGRFVSHAFDARGTYVVRATVTDDRGRSTTTTTTVEVGGDGPAVGPLGGAAEPPADPDGDGTYEDVDGSGSVDFLDVVLFLDVYRSPAVTDDAAAFDFDGSGGVSFLDVVALFERL
jgi:PKD repeat protein